MEYTITTRMLLRAASLWAVHSLAVGQTWEPVASVPTGGAPRQYAAGISHGGFLYAIHGTPWQNGADRDGCAHRFNYTTWAAVAPIDGEGPIISGASGVDALNRMVMYGGFVLGDLGPGPDRVYDPIEGPTTQIAERRAPEPAVGYFAWARDDQGRLYGFGGGPGEGGPNSGYCDRYDAIADAWTVLASMPTIAADACATYDGDGHMLVIGGINATGTARLANVARYDIVGDTWSDTAVPDLPVAVSGARAVLGGDGRVYVIGGETGPIGGGVTQPTAYKLEPATNTWVAAPTMATPRKWFACVLGDDDYIYAIGGDNDNGGTNTVERLFTAACAEITGPEDCAAFEGSVAGFAVTVQGAPPFTYQWRKDEAELEDGPTGTGSTISGATTASLTIVNPGGADAGMYDVVVSNSCGSVPSQAASLTLRTPPVAPRVWVAERIHPGWADGASQAHGIADGRIGGWAQILTQLPDERWLLLAHPFLWDAANHTPTDITPPGSVGGAIVDAEGNLLVGWFWHVYSCPPWSCAWQSAGYWLADTLAFTETHMSGAEYDIAAGTDGVRFVSNATFEYTPGNYTFKPLLWTPPHSVTNLDPGAVVRQATVNAIEGERQYGSIIRPGSALFRAAMWRGSAASMVEVHPAGYTESRISGAGDGQCVGQVETSSTQHPALWVAGTASVVELQSAGEAYAARGGVQVGIVGSRAALWIGSAETYVDLHAFAPAGFTSSAARDVEVGPEGEITVVGYGYNSVSAQSEALVWTGGFLPGDCNRDGFVDMADFEDFAACLLGPGQGTSPECDCFDLDGEGDVTLADFAELQLNFTGR